MLHYPLEQGRGSVGGALPWQSVLSRGRSPLTVLPPCPVLWAQQGVLSRSLPQTVCCSAGAVVGGPLSRSCAWSYQSFGASSLGLRPHVPAVAPPLPPLW
ncbi:mucolipin-1 [Platysternon megacephalum]|uniref:Mucolipin-1 n=1 Tax=Platysternon megacephalum TaxID=55544 RepID=A0A4D9DM00_9SAUR|nr:mucolipin-1 [Platysternon megacephalum]